MKYTAIKITSWHCILSAELTKNALLQTIFFGDFAHWASWIYCTNACYKRNNR